MNRNILYNGGRRFSVCVLVLLFCLSSFFCVYTTATSGVLSVESISAQPGDTVQIHLMLDENPGIIAIRLLLRYNKAALQLTAVTNGTVFEEATANFGNNFADVPFVMLWEDSLSAKNNTDVGTLVTCSFHVLDSTVGNCPITVSLDIGSTFNANLIEVPFSVQNGMVTVGTPTACEHKNTAWVDSTVATCTQSGTKNQTCSDCGSILATETIPATVHTFSVWKTVVTPTETSEGRQLRRCTSCENAETRTVAVSTTLPTKIIITTVEAASYPTTNIVTDEPVNVQNDTIEITTNAVTVAEGATSAILAEPITPDSATVDSGRYNSETSSTPLPTDGSLPAGITNEADEQPSDVITTNPAEEKYGKAPAIICVVLAICLAGMVAFTVIHRRKKRME